MEMYLKMLLSIQLRMGKILIIVEYLIVNNSQSESEYKNIALSCLSIFLVTVQYMNKMKYGVLVPNDGCYIEEQNVTMRFNDYEVLVSNANSG